MFVLSSSSIPVPKAGGMESLKLRHENENGLGGSFIALFPEVSFVGITQISPSPYSRI